MPVPLPKGVAAPSLDERSMFAFHQAATLLLGTSVPVPRFPSVTRPPYPPSVTPALFPFPPPPSSDILGEAILPAHGPVAAVVHNFGISAGCGTWTALMLLNTLTSVCSLGSLRYTLYVEGNTEITLSPVYFLVTMLAEAGIGKSFWINFFLVHPLETALEREITAFFALHEDDISEKLGKANVKAPSISVDNGTLPAYTAVGGVNATTVAAWRESADVRASLMSFAPTSVDVVAKALSRLEEEPDQHERRAGKVPVVTISRLGEESVTLKFGGDGGLLDDSEEDEVEVACSFAVEVKGNVSPPAIIINVFNAETAVSAAAEGTYKMALGAAQPCLSSMAYVCALATTELGKSARAGDGGSGRNTTGGVGSSFNQVTSMQLR